jgi:hypothetical protein
MKKNIQDVVVIYLIKKEMCWVNTSICLSTNTSIKKNKSAYLFLPRIKQSEK